MNEFYYQIKGKKGEDDYSMSNWAFPPIFSGKVTATDKKDAKTKIEDEYGKKFPLRVLQKDLDTNEFLLSIQEMDDKSRFHRLFEERECEVCGDSFRVIDKYNDHNCSNKSPDVCSGKCEGERIKLRQIGWNESQVMKGIHKPTIYKIQNVRNQKVYIGKTTQAFTLRWYQHFFQSSGTKFHEAIKESEITDWVFSVLEFVDIDECKAFSEAATIISEREQHYISMFNSIENGYNSINAKNEK